MGGQADGLESDSTGKIYLTSPEHNSINTFDPSTGLVSPFVRNPIMAWPDTLRYVLCQIFVFPTNPANSLYSCAASQTTVSSTQH